MTEDKNQKTSDEALSEKINGGDDYEREAAVLAVIEWLEARNEQAKRIANAAFHENKQRALLEYTAIINARYEDILYLRQIVRTV